MQSRRPRSLKDTLLSDRANTGKPGTIREIFDACVDYYLTIDNPEPQGARATVSRFFSSRGTTGRKRAIEYNRDVINHVAHHSNELLLKQVWADLCNPDGPLGTSKKLRLNFLDGLCVYYGVSEKDISIKQNELMKILYAASVTVHSASRFPEVYFEMQARTELVRPHVRETLNTIKENPSFRLSRHDEDDGL